MSWIRHAIGLTPILFLGAAGQAEPYFTDQTTASGIDFRHTFGSAEKHHIVEAHGGGGALFDYDGDGYLDLYIVNGATFDTWQDKSGPGNVLYHNRGDGTFTDVSQATGTDDASWGAGAAVGDIDNDGHRDLYVTNFGPNVLYRNTGDFTDITQIAGVGGDDYSASAAFFDYDNDGDLDLYVANYVVFDARQAAAEEPRLCSFFGGLQVYCGPKGMRGAADVLYRNDGRTFTDVTISSGVATANRYYGLGVVPIDYDGDGDLDLYVANDETPNVLWRNNGDSTFADVALLTGVAYNEEGSEEAGMGIDVGDIDNDGDDDLYVTNFFRETNTLYRNEGGYPWPESPQAVGQRRFTDVTAAVGLAAPSISLLGWGTRFFDADHDGWLDLFVANGHVYPQVDVKVAGSPYRQPNQLFRNMADGTGTYQDISAHAGPGLQVVAVSRGAAFGDIDNDGDVDVFVSNLNDVPSLLRNDGHSPGHWLLIEVQGTTSNRDGVGARIHVSAAGQSQWRSVNGAVSFLSHSDIRAHFGLGAAGRVEQVDITWPNGMTDVVRDVPVDRLLVVRQGGDYEIGEFGTASR